MEEGQAQRVDRSYFDGYGGFGIHREMLGDRHRTETYRRALECNPSTVAGKRVLDVGCGTGILSLFAARGGAASVVRRPSPLHPALRIFQPPLGLERKKAVPKQSALPFALPLSLLRLSLRVGQEAGPHTMSWGCPVPRQPPSPVPPLAAAVCR